MQKQIFKEDQVYQRWELTLLIGFLTLGLTYRFIEQNFINPVENAISTTAFLFIVALLGGVYMYFRSMRLSVKVTDSFISFRYHPLQEKRHKINWSEVTNYEIVETSSVAQWNGWNVNFSNEKIFSVNGKNGIRLYTKSGEQYFIGSKDTQGLKKAVDKVFP